MSIYRTFKEEWQQKFNNLPVGFAFSNKQFEDMKNKLNVSKNKELVSIGAGCFIKKTDLHLLDEYVDQRKESFNELMKDDDFMYDAFRYELGNHEYCISYDAEDALAELDMTIDQLNADKRALKIFKIAKKDYLKAMDNFYNGVQEEEQCTIKKIKTMDDWKGSFENDFEIGDRVSDEIYKHFLDILPPTTDRTTLFQLGEPQNHVNGKVTYLTLYNDGYSWIYAGNCYEGSKENV